MKSQQDSYTRAEIDQLVEDAYRTLETAEERLDRRCDDIYFPMDLTMSSLTSQIEAIHREIVEIQRYIARRPEASTLIDRRNNISTDSRRRTSIDGATNQGRLVPKMTSDMSDTNNHGEDISDDAYATHIRNQFQLESLGERLQKIENETATMKDKWHRGDEEPKLTSNLIELNSACLGAWYTWDRILQISLEGEKLVEREDRNFCLPAGPDTCLSILAFCDRYPKIFGERIPAEYRARPSVDIEEEESIDVHMLTSIDRKARRKLVWSQPT
ncbi:hypothetical protein F2Q69_00007075 [Brassica cretica]|uniref:Uncharacterized protein n=1 Tax=Brassica cretica TaxID=69181 RepID=A0A8S9P0T2_BRACR|nr:hypothetical protein F2Q69_00007075 [Brassica cretica]